MGLDQSEGHIPLHRRVQSFFTRLLHEPLLRHRVHSYNMPLDGGLPLAMHVVVMMTQRDGAEKTKQWLVSRGCPVGDDPNKVVNWWQQNWDSIIAPQLLLAGYDLEKEELDYTPITKKENPTETKQETIEIDASDYGIFTPIYLDEGPERTTQAAKTHETNSEVIADLAEFHSKVIDILQKAGVEVLNITEKQDFPLTHTAFVKHLKSHGQQHVSEQEKTEGLLQLLKDLNILYSGERVGMLIDVANTDTRFSQQGEVVQRVKYSDFSMQLLAQVASHPSNFRIVNGRYYFDKNDDRLIHLDTPIDPILDHSSLILVQKQPAG